MVRGDYVRCACCVCVCVCVCARQLQEFEHKGVCGVRHDEMEVSESG